MTSFRSDIEVFADSEIQVKETIGVDFLQPRHGIFRHIPFRGTDTAGKSWFDRIRLISVTLDGKTERVDEYDENDNHVWKIGKADETLTGAHTYVITYSVVGAIGRYEDHDELYWNVSGDGWEVPLPTVVAGVGLPEPVEAEDLKTRCFTGSYGSTDEEGCVVIASADEVGFASKGPGQPMTVVVGWPKGIVAPGDPALPMAERIAAALRMFWYAVLALVPVGVFIGCFRYWRRHGDDKPFGSTVVEFEAPDGLHASELPILLGQKTSLAPGLVDLASRGYLEFTEVPGGFLKSKDYILKSKKPYEGATDLKPHEAQLLRDLFRHGEGGETKVSKLSGKFHAEAAAYAAAVKKSVEDRPYWEVSPDAVRKAWATPAVVLGVAGIGLFFLPFLPGQPFVSISLLACCAVVIGFGVVMPRYNAKGREVVGKARGFREFIRKVEKHRAPWMEEQAVFEKVLPFALALGLGKKWMKAFQGLTIKPPNWYHGATAGAFAFGDFEKGITSMNSAVTTAAAPPHSSGSGGGGFSGGGGGGGGGGSW